MASVLRLAITTPTLSKSYSPPAVSSSSRLSPPHPVGHRILLPVGSAHLNYLRLALHHNHDFSSLDAHLEAERQAKEKLLADGSAGSEDDLGVGDEPETAELLALDPKEWKVLQFFLPLVTRFGAHQLSLSQKQDHYAVLGLSKFRYQATPDQIKVARTLLILLYLLPFLSNKQRTPRRPQESPQAPP